jgi:hypothetical protein
MSLISEQESQDHLRKTRGTHALLLTKRANHEKLLAELGRERASIAFDAHAGSKSARTRLDRIHDEYSRADSELLSLDAAITEAQSRVASAEAALATAHKASQAKEILDLLPALRNHGTGLDRAAANVLAEYEALQAVIRQIRILSERQYDDVGLPRDSSPVVSEALLRVSCRRAVEAALVGTDLETMHLAPPDRHTCYELASAWAERAAAWARRFVGEE